MKYWSFNVANLIADFKRNQRTLAGVLEGLEYTRRLLDDPLTDKTEGDVKAYIRMLEMREAEYRWYTDMVILGLNELPEVERNILKWWLIDHWRDEEIMETCGILTSEELRRIKNISLAKFHDIILP